MVKRKSMPTSCRAAIWRAHERRCIYCTDLIHFSDLSIDHIIPYSLIHTKEQYESLKKEYDLSENFNIDSLYNYVPAHRHCNQQKCNTIFSKSRAIHFLSIAERMAEKARTIEKSIKERLKRDKFTITLQIALSEELITADEICMVLAEHSRTRGRHEVIEPLIFGNDALERFFSNADVDMLYDRKLLPRSGGLEELELMSLEDIKDRVRVVTCREWAEAVRDGYFAGTTYTIKEETIFRRMYAIVKTLATAIAPSVSYITDYAVGIGNVDLLPLAILPSISDEGIEKILVMKRQEITIENLVDSGEVVVIDQSEASIHLQYDGMGLVLNEILRADISGDGVEDVLVGMYEYCIHGTHGAGGAVLLSRKSPSDKFSLLSSDTLSPEKEGR